MSGGGFNLSALALRHRAVTLFAILVIAAAGIHAYFGLGRAEDPPFTIKQMLVQAQWPGASAEETMRELTDRLERKLEEIPSLDYVQSYTQPGRVTLTLSLRDNTPPARVPDLWYQVRKKIGDIRQTLPEGTLGPFFNDEFGDVFGIVYAMTGDGFTLPELKHVAEDVREHLLSVPGVAKVQIVGTQEERVYVDLSYRKLARLGLTAQDIIAAIRRENSVVAGGFVDTPRDRIYVRTENPLTAPERLRALPVQAGGHLIPLGDLATITRGTEDPPTATMRFNGKPALGLAISMAGRGNILDLGQRLAARLAEIAPTLPLGVHIAPLNDQSRVVAADVADFQEAFLEALAIVLAVSFISLGWRTGIVVAISVPLVLAGVLVGMKLMGIDLQRISLGAMIIALGLLVDDAIIAVETMVVKLEQGWDRFRAGSFAYTSTAFPMLTGTLVTAAGYLPIGLAQSGTGEYTGDIFRVVGLALVLSWLVAVLFVPYLGASLLPAPKQAGAHAGHAVYDTPLYNRFRRLVAWCIRRRFVVIGVTLLAFLVSLAGFTRVPQQFFPNSDRLEVLIDMRLPEGSSFAATAAEVARLEAVLNGEKGIRSYAVYTGQGTPRFFLAFTPVLINANFAQIVINTASFPAREALLAKLTTLVDDGAFPDLRVRAARLELGPPVGYPVQFRVIGPDPQTLRRIALAVRQAMRANPHIRNVSDDWGNPAKIVTVRLDQDKARLLGLSSEDIANALQTLQQGTTVTQFREGTDLIPVVLRAEASERRDLAGLGDIEIAAANGHAVPLSQVAEVGVGLEQPTLWRRNRTPTLTVRGDIADGTQAPVVTAEILPALDAVKAALPPGYRIETGGAMEESAKGQASVNAGMPLMVVAMLSLLMLQLQGFGRVAMVILTAPLGLIGVAAALLATGAPFGFVAMLGFIALAGIIMRNSVILVDQIEQDILAGLAPAEAIVEATIRRSRPILLTAAAAILALVPLAFSVFWGPMAIAIMGGLMSATLLTLFFVPALYAAWSRVPRAAHAARGVMMRVVAE
ncbi:MAG TPA: efflux RND transporter permease subunit [Acetobacteraceae bacterium]|nr:efflux RND transporter permease subunit [Acetobacteraceae bacterium]